MANIRKRVLVVEDDCLMGMEMKDLIEGLGYEVSEIVSTGESALDAMRIFNPDLILLDIKLKGSMKGIDVARQVRLVSGTPIIFLTGYKDMGTVKQATVIQNSFFVTKPFDTEQLSSTIKEILSD